MRPPIFIELCAGTAALSLRLQGGRGAKPPVSRMGAKTGYADAILGVLGLYPGLGAESYLWCEPDDGVRGLLMAYAQPEVLRAAAAILRSWKDEEPRALWERLRAELKAGAAVEGAEGVARFCTVTAWTNNGGSMYSGPDRPSSCHPPGWVAAITASGLAARLGAVPTLPPTLIACDGRAVTPEEVAKWCVLADQSHQKGNPDSGFKDDLACFERGTRGRPHHVARRLSDRFDDFPAWPLVTVTADARTLTPPKLPVGVIAYMDPPYLNTTGYKHDLSRAEVVRMARLWADAGATVCISEAEPIGDLVADGWHAVEISATRRGQKRTFSKQQAEWLTLNRPPTYTPRQTMDLFGGAP